MILNSSFLKFTDKNKYFLLLVLSILILVFSGFNSIKNNQVKTVNIWNGYITLLVEKDTDSRIVYTELENLNIFNDISARRNTFVEFTNYHDIEYITLDKLDNRFNPLDPRLTPYMKDLGKYFTAEVNSTLHEVYYLKTDMHSADAVKVISSVLPEAVKWTVPENDPYSAVKTLPVVLYLLIVFFIMIFNRKHAFFYFFVSALWFFLIIENSVVFFYPAILVLILMIYITGLKDIVVKKFIENGKFSTDCDISNQFAVILPLVLFAVFMTAASGEIAFSQYITLFYAFMFSAAAGGVILFYDLNRASGFFHSVFCNVVILNQRKNQLFENINKIPPIVFFAVIYILSMSALPAFIDRKTPEIIMPSPYRLIETGETITLDSLKKISEKEKTHKMLPDFSDYIKHLSYQIRLPYDSNYRFPETDESITISHYKYNENNYEQEKVVRIRFTDQWLIDIIGLKRDNSIFGLMLNNYGIIQAAMIDIITPSVRITFPIIYSLFYPLLLFLIFRTRNSVKFYSWKTIIPVIRRRKQQAA